MVNHATVALKEEMLYFRWAVACGDAGKSIQAMLHDIREEELCIGITSNVTVAI